MTPPHKWSLWRVALLAFLAMCAEDLCYTVMTIYEAHFQAAPAAAGDAIGWLFGLVCSALAIESIIRDGWHTRRSLTIIGAVTVANLAGTYVGVAIASALTHHP